MDKNIRLFVRFAYIALPLQVQYVCGTLGISFFFVHLEIDIGGSFRVPEVMTQSGAILKEIGTTNKTHLRDYENAINENTAMLMKVHKSNYSIEGFSSEVRFEEISKLAQKNGLIDYFDMSSKLTSLKKPSIL